MASYLLAIDQGTTSSRAIVFDQTGQIVAQAQQEFRQIFPQDGWVEHDPEDIWSSTLAVCKEALANKGLTAQDILSIGITNQRETTLVWDRDTGKPIYNAIVWQDRRTAELCGELKDKGHESSVREKTGLLLDPYFSGTKLKWILDHVEGARALAEQGKLAFGTVDTFLLWRLTGGQVHATDATNASRTMIFNIHNQQWDPQLMDMLAIPESVLPEVKDCADDYGHTQADLFGGEIAIGSVAGDQQAALVGQACFQPGMTKSTYGTGCFMITNTGSEALTSKNRLLTTVGYRLKGTTTYAIEGSIFMAGATIQWMRDGLKLVTHASETEALAKQANPQDQVYMVPAFTGLGAPYWDPDARGAIVGMTRDTGVAEVVRAGLDSVCYQTRDLVEAMKGDGADHLTQVRVDGGMVVNDWLVQRLANILDVQVDRPTVAETTALGVAYLAGLQAGIYQSLEEIGKMWQCEHSFHAEPGGDAGYEGWKTAVQRVRS